MVIDFVARQVGVDGSEVGAYEWGSDHYRNDGERECCIDETRIDPAQKAVATDISQN